MLSKIYVLLFFLNGGFVCFCLESVYFWFVFTFFHFSMGTGVFLFCLFFEKLAISKDILLNRWKTSDRNWKWKDFISKRHVDFIIDINKNCLSWVMISKIMQNTIKCHNSPVTHISNFDVFASMRHACWIAGCTKKKKTLHVVKRNFHIMSTWHFKVESLIRNFSLFLVLLPIERSLFWEDYFCPGRTVLF